LNEDFINKSDINTIFTPLAKGTGGDKTVDKTTILITATRLGLTDVVSRLIEMGADRDTEVDAENNGEYKNALKILLECAGIASTSNDSESAVLTEAYKKIREMLEVKKADDTDNEQGTDNTEGE
jgi:hypothetical protein